MEGLYLAAGVIIGIILRKLFDLIRSATGVLKIDHSNPEKDIYRIEIDELETLNRASKVILRVDHHADLSQK